MSVAKRKIAITGINGYLGRMITKRILETTDWEIIGFTSNKDVCREDDRLVVVLNEELEAKIITDASIDILVHCAFSRRFASNEQIAKSIEFSDKVYKAAYKQGRCKVINISTVAVYGSSNEYQDEGAMIAPGDIYGMAKYASEVLLRSTFGNSGRATNLRLSSIAQSQRVLPSFIEQAKSHKQILIKGGTQEFSYLDVNDAVDAICQMINYDRAWKESYNIAINKKRYSIIFLAESVAKIANEVGLGEVKINVTPSDVNICVGWNSTLFSDEVGWMPKVDIEDTIREMF